MNYAKRQQGRQHATRARRRHLPFKINMSGVIPPIFASELDSVPGHDRELVRHERRPCRWLQRRRGEPVAGPADLHHAVRVADHVLLLLLHGARVQFARDGGQPRRKSGAFIPGIRPGQQTAEYIDKVLTRLTFWGALYITIVCLLPEFADPRVQRAVLRSAARRS